MVCRQDADSADTLQIRDVATFWLSIGYKFGCIGASDSMFDSMGGFSASSYPMKT